MKTTPSFLPSFSFAAPEKSLKGASSVLLLSDSFTFSVGGESGFDRCNIRENRV